MDTWEFGPLGETLRSKLMKPGRDPHQRRVEAVSWVRRSLMQIRLARTILVVEVESTGSAISTAAWCEGVIDRSRHREQLRV